MEISQTDFEIFQDLAPVLAEQLRRAGFDASFRAYGLFDTRSDRFNLNGLRHVIEPAVRDDRLLRGRDVRGTILAALEPTPRWEEDALPANWFAYAETFFPVIQQTGGPMRTIRERDWKLIERDGTLQLYRLESDPDESKDLAENRDRQCKRLARILEELGPGKATTRAEVNEGELERLRAMGYVE